MFGFNRRHNEILGAIAALGTQVHLLRKEGAQLMAKLEDFIADVNTFKTDTTAALARAQKSIDDLKAAPGTLTPEQQAALDAADASLKDADTTVNQFDVPVTPPTA